MTVVKLVCDVRESTDKPRIRHDSDVFGEVLSTAPSKLNPMYATASR